MLAALESDMENELEGLFTGSTVPKLNLPIDDLMKTAQLFETPAQAWARDRKACSKEDQEKGRGKLIMNAEVEGVEKLEGTITERDGIEYRVMIDENLRGMRDKDGSIRMGYWADPIKLNLQQLPPITVEPEFVDKWDRWGGRMGCLNHNIQGNTIMGLGVDVVDLGPTPMDLVSAELPRATLRQQKRTLVQVWRDWNYRQLAIGEKPQSLKEYARGSKWGRAWLERKR